MDSFHAVLIEGVFFREGTTLFAKNDDGSSCINVVELLTPLVDKEVHLALHFLPPLPPDQTRWGGGCCLWEPSGKCPAGHHENPGLLLNISGRGVLRREDEKWWLDQFDGTKMEVPVALLEGHKARIAGASMFDVEKMKAQVLGSLDKVEQLEMVGKQANDLKDLLTQLQNIMKKDAS